MGLFSGRRAVDDTPQRSMTLPFDWSVLNPGATITDYASVDANGEMRCGRSRSARRST